MEHIQKLLASIGGITVILAFMFTFLRNIIEKYISSLLEKSAVKELEKVKNKFSRSMSAYELLLNKEFKYYQNIDKIYASLMGISGSGNITMTYCNNNRVLELQ